MVDGRKLQASEYGTPIVVDPGPHKIRSVTSDGDAWESEVVGITGGAARVEVPFVQPMRAQPTGTPVPTSSSAPAAEPGAAASASSAGPGADATPTRDPGATQRWIGVAVGGAGILAFGVGTVFGLSASSKQKDSNADNPCTDNKCDPMGLQLRKDAIGAATASTVFFVVGAAAVGAGVALYLTAPKGPKTAGLVVAPSFGGREGGGIVARGSF
jgi:hypothetical protein